MHRSRPSFVAPLLVCSLVALSGCGDDDAAEATATTSTTADHRSIAVSATDYRYRGLPGRLAADSSVALHNTSTAELHELVLLRLADDETRPVDQLLALPPDQLQALFQAPPALVLVAPPGEDGFVAVGDKTISDPGRYVAVCFIPTGANPQAYLDALEADPGRPPSVDGGPPHFTAGMYQEVTVR
jgi:hypothetical protein